MASFQRIIELFTKKIVKKLLKIWSWDPGSEIRDPEKPIPDPGSRGQKAPDPRSQIRIRNTDTISNYYILYSTGAIIVKYRYIL